MSPSDRELKALPEPEEHRPPKRRPGLYVHVPYCSAICPYCDFAVVRSGHGSRTSFVESLSLEVLQISRSLADPVDGDGPGSHPWTHTEEFGTVYLGGGTPTALATEEISQIQDHLRANLPIAPDAHWSIEANPEDISGSILSDLQVLGFQFLSLGVQSFHQPTLDFLGRRHTREQALHACGLSVESGFATVSIDLMYGMECLDLGTWTEVLETAAAFNGGHLSCYELTLHEGTAFGTEHAKGRLQLISDDARADCFRQTVEVLAGKGYEIYEVSNFAFTEDKRSPHNTKYWQSVPYLGIGPSAHSFDGERRWWNRRSVRGWAKALQGSENCVEDLEVLSPDQQTLEWLLTRLRTVDGADLKDFERRFGWSLERERHSVLADFAGRRLAEVQGRRLVPSIEGLLLADSMVLALL